MENMATSFQAIDREYRAKILRYMSGFVGRDEAADLTQITMMKVSEHLGEFRRESSLSTWIYRVATNVALDRLRRKSPEMVAIGDESEDDQASGAGVPPQLQALSAETAAERDQMSACVREFVERLPSNYSTVLVLGEIEGFTNSEIAEITGLSLETVKIRLHRARLKLREALQAGCTLQTDERSEIACDRKPLLRSK